MEETRLTGCNDLGMAVDYAFDLVVKYKHKARAASRIAQRRTCYKSSEHILKQVEQRLRDRRAARLGRVPEAVEQAVALISKGKGSGRAIKIAAENVDAAPIRAITEAVRKLYPEGFLVKRRKARSNYACNQLVKSYTKEESPHN